MTTRYKILLGTISTFQLLLIFLQLFDIVYFCEWYWLLWPAYLIAISELATGIYSIRRKLKLKFKCGWKQFKSDLYHLWWKE
jgi:MFS superfamily sulfate permease-like transporter